MGSHKSALARCCTDDFQVQHGTAYLCGSKNRRANVKMVE
jgi:hypothetical protein